MPPTPTQALFQQALTLHQSGRLEDAERAYRQIMRVDPRHYPAHCMLGRMRLEQGRNQEAGKLFEAAVKLDGRSHPGLAGYGLALLRLRKFRDAAAILERAIAAEPRDGSLHHNLGDALRGQGRFAEALTAYERALALDPRAAQTWTGRADALLGLQRPEDALADCARALSLAPPSAHVLLVRAGALDAMGRDAEAIEAYGQALAASPNEQLAATRRGLLLFAAGRYAEAIADFTAALKLAPRSAELLDLRARALCRIRRFEEALADCDAAIAIDRKDHRAHVTRGAALDGLARFEQAVDSLGRAASLLRPGDPDYVATLTNRSAALLELRRLAEAMEDLDKILALDPRHYHAFGAMALCRMMACDWTDRDRHEAELRQAIVEGKSEIPPGVLLGQFDDPALQLAGARHYTALHMPGEGRAYAGPAYAHDRLRIAYLSADLHDHATARLAIELFERHDRSRFEVRAISFGLNDGSPMRARCVAAFEGFHDVRGLSDEETLALMRQLQIDIAVDLKGFTAEARGALFARRPAPLQVNYLGFPGTLGADYYDYILADATVAPMAMQPFFDEKIVHLPHSYQPNDSTRPVPPLTMTRAEAGLPEAGFVFCCFNNNFKIAPAVFDAWMRLLRAAEGAVLWLIADNPLAVENLRKEAAARGVDPERLVFAPRVDPRAHLARHGLADLFLDTGPYGAHTTASDALWMGLPVVTCLGRTFASRVGGSLCRATGLEALVADSLEDYERLALELAGDPARLAGIKSRLAEGRMSHPLFDPDLYRRGVEAAFTTMWERHRAGQPPEPFAVGSLA